MSLLQRLLYDDVMCLMVDKYYELRCLDFNVKDIQMKQHYEISDTAERYIRTRKLIKQWIQAMRAIMV